jgi:nicotinamide mononucleotide (NMN) deamidase PncC
VESAGHVNKPWALFAIVIAVCCLCMMQSALAGSIVGWGGNQGGEATHPDGNDFVAIAAGSSHSLALKSDGSIVGWGYNSYG